MSHSIPIQTKPQITNAATNEHRPSAKFAANVPATVDKYTAGAQRNPVQEQVSVPIADNELHTSSNKRQSIGTNGASTGRRESRPGVGLHVGQDQSEGEPEPPATGTHQTDGAQCVRVCAQLARNGQKDRRHSQRYGHVRADKGRRTHNEAEEPR